MKPKVNYSFFKHMASTHHLCFASIPSDLRLILLQHQYWNHRDLRQVPRH